MSDRLPLTEVGGDEIIARVTFQIILQDYHSRPEEYDSPVEALLHLAAAYHQANIPIIDEQLTLAAVWVGNGGTVATWLRARVIITTGRTTRLARVGRTRTR